MAKKKVEDFRKSGQGYYIVGKVMDAKTESKKSERTGKSWIEYKARIKTPEGVSIFVKKARFTPQEGKVEPQFVADMFDEWNDVITMITKEEDVFVSVSSRKAKEKPMYNWFTNYENDEGQISYNIDNFIRILDTYANEDGTTTINFAETTDLFENRETEFGATMYVADKDEDRILLTDGKEDYPNTLLVNLQDGMENKAEIGQGYAFKLKLKKGQRHKVEAGTTNWDNEEAVGYDPDQVMVVSVDRKVDDMILGGKKSKSRSTSKKEKLEDVSPF